jgi:DNA repair exonuclease SbcCD ATPase subunit
VSTHEQRVAELSTRIEAIDTQLGELHLQRHLAALDAAIGDKEALKLVARCDASIDALLKEKQTLNSAQSRLAEIAAAELSEAEKEKRREREAEARDAASALMALNEQLDQHLVALREMFERRASLLSALDRTETISHALISKLQGKAPATAACCRLGLHKFISMETVSPISHRNLSDANSILTTVGKGGSSP